MSRDAEEYLGGMANSTVAAFLMASAAYFFNFLNWYVCLFEPSCVNPPLDIVTGVINWMGGPVDIGFYTFIASEGVRYMILAALEKRRMRRQWEAEREAWKAEREAERKAWEAEREAEREASEKKIAELREELEKARKDGRAA